MAMRRIFVLAVVLAVLFFHVTSVDACGDKLLVLGRGVRFQRAYKAPHPANVLVLWRVDPHQPNSGKDAQFRVFLTGVGHRVTMAYSPEETRTALQSQEFDVLVFEFEDEIYVDSSLASVGKRPSALPIIYRPSKEIMTSARQKYRWVIKAPAKPGQLLAAIDELMDQRSKLGTATITQKH